MTNNLSGEGEKKIKCECEDKETDFWICSECGRKSLEWQVIERFSPNYTQGGIGMFVPDESVQLCDILDFTLSKIEEYKNKIKSRPIMNTKKDNPTPETKREWVEELRINMIRFSNGVLNATRLFRVGEKTPKIEVVEKTVSDWTELLREDISHQIELARQEGELMGVAKILDKIWRNSYYEIGKLGADRIKKELEYYFGENWSTDMYDFVGERGARLSDVKTLKELTQPTDSINKLIK